MAAPYQIIPATPAEIPDILSLEKLCFSNPWEERLVRSFVVAACLPKKGYVASVIMEGRMVVAYAFASQHEGQLLVERLGVRLENLS